MKNSLKNTFLFDGKLFSQPEEISDKWKKLFLTSHKTVSIGAMTFFFKNWPQHSFNNDFHQ